MTILDSARRAARASTLVDNSRRVICVLYFDARVEVGRLSLLLRYNVEGQAAAIAAPQIEALRG